MRSRQWQCVMFSCSESQMRSGAQMDCSPPKPAVLSTSRPLSPSLSTIHPHHNVYSPFIYSRPFLCHFPFMCVFVCPLMLAESECDCIVNMCSGWFLHDCRMHWWFFIYFFAQKCHKMPLTFLAERENRPNSWTESITLFNNRIIKSFKDLKMKLLSSVTHPYVVPNPFIFKPQGYF